MRRWLAPATAGLVAFLPFMRGALGGQSFYFRDLSRHFFPLRRFIDEGLRQGELRYWNPYLHEGTPVWFPPLSYPIDMLQALLPNEAGLSLLLALHVPLAAIAFFALARALGRSAAGAAGGGLVYALGGFALSTLNLYFHLQALAWAPLVIWGLLIAARGAHRQVALAALLTALAISTTSAEIVIQTVLIGLVLAAPRPWQLRSWIKMGASLALAGGVSSVILVHVSGQVAQSERAAGLPTESVLAHSLHPLTLLQVIVGGLYGDLSNYSDLFWGHNFVDTFPYYLSFYLGATALAVAAVGAIHAGPLRRRLALLLLAGGFICLGRFVGFETLMDAVPSLRVFRYPVKAFFTVHLSVALLTAFGLDALTGRLARSGGRLLASIAAVLGALLAAAPVLPRLFPGWTQTALAVFFPPSFPWLLRVQLAERIVRDAAVGGVATLVVSAIAALGLAGRLRSGVVTLAVTALIAADLLRTGAGLNPMVSASHFQLSPEMEAWATTLRQEGGRVFTCHLERSPAFRQAWVQRPGSHEVWKHKVLVETLTPYLNMTASLPSAYGADMTGLVPLVRLLSTDFVSCQPFEAIADRLRRAGVAHVVSIDPLTHPDLVERAVVQPREVSPLSIHIYSLRGALPLREIARHVLPAAGPDQAQALANRPGFQEEGGTAVEGVDHELAGPGGRIVRTLESAGRIEIEAVAERPTALLIRDGYAVGWSATVNGASAHVLRADGRHRAIPIGAGSNRVVLWYQPPRIWFGLALTLLSSLITAWLWRRDPGPP